MSDQFVLLRASLPPGWVALPTDATVDPQIWAESYQETAADGVEPSEYAIGLEPATAMLAAFVRQAQAEYAAVPGLSAHLAFAYHPDPLARVLIYATATAFPFEERPLRRSQLMKSLGSDDSLVGEREVSKITLPLGKSVRMRRMFTLPADDPDHRRADEQEGLDVREGMTIVALPRKLPGFVWLNASWVDLVWGERLAGNVDELAGGLEIEFQQ